MSGRNIVQYGRRAKHRLHDNVQPTPKRQKLEDGGVVDSHNNGVIGVDSHNDDVIGVDSRGGDDALVATRPNTPEPVSSSRSASTSHTPSAKPKDLSQLFPSLSSPLSSRSPTKSIAKRMLVRARTEPALSPSPMSPKNSLVATSSLPTMVAAPATARSSPSPASPSPTLSKPAVRTYSQSRSFLVSLPAPSSSRDPRRSSDTDDIVRESYTDLRTRWGVDNSDDDPFHVPGITNELMSLSELTSKGESRRFLDEVGYLFEGLEYSSMSTSVKRSSAVEIVLKMCDPDFVRKAKAADFIGRAWDAMKLAGAGSGDKVLNPCLAFFVALISRNKRDVDNLAQRDGFFDVMLRLLQVTRDNDDLLPLQDTVARKSGSSKQERAALANLRNIITTSSQLFSPQTTPSTRLLASISLSSITPNILPRAFFRPVLASLLIELALLRAEDATYDLAHTDNCLRILDTFLLRAWDKGSDHDHFELNHDLSRGLVALCALPEPDAPIARQCIESAFRVLINLSHRSPAWCALLLRNPAALPAILPHILLSLVKREDGDGDEHALDRQCLALGVLTNVVIAIPETGERIREMQLDPACPRTRHCVRACHCAGRISALECLVRLFHAIDVKRENATAAEIDFFRIHLAALLCLLTADRNPIDTRVPELVASVRQFLDFYQSLNDDVGEGEDVRARVARALRALEAAGAA